MGKAIKVVGSIVIVLAAVLLLTSVTGFEPKGRIPGLWLKGESAATPVTDWSFTDHVREIKIQTQTPYLLPHSVTIWCAVYNGNLYVTSARGRQWVEDVVRDPRVRLKIEDKVFDRTLSLVDDPVEKAAVLQAKGRKYAGWKVPSVAASAVFRVNPA